MGTLHFIESLKKIPTLKRVEYLKLNGFDSDFINEYKNSYSFKKKQKYMDIEDPLKNLVINYDGTDVKIGMVSFEATPYEDINYYYFGKFETDLLAINKNLLRVELLEYGTDNHVLYDCAQNSAKFLDAVLLAAIFMEKRAFDDSLYNDQKLLFNVAEQCADLAGGKDYLEFYTMFLGYDPS